MTSENQSQAPAPSKSKAKIVLYVLAGLLVYGIAGALAGSSVVLAGLLVVAVLAAVVLMVLAKAQKEPAPAIKKTGSALLGRPLPVLAACALVLVGVVAGRNNASERLVKETQAKSAAEANKSALEKAQARLTALAPTAPAADVVAACQELGKLGAMTPEHAGRCGDAALQHGQNLVVEGKFADAVPVLELASQSPANKAAAMVALTSAKAEGALAQAEMALKNSIEKLEAKDDKAAISLVRDASQSLKGARAAKADEARAADLAKRIEVQLAALHVDESGKPVKAKTWWDSDGLRRAGDGFWALFKDIVPGSDEFERKASEEKRADQAKLVKESTYILVADGKSVELGEYDFKKKAFPVTVEGVQDGNIQIALGPAKVEAERAPAAQGGGIFSFHWAAAPLRFSIPVPEDQAKVWREKHEGGLFSSVALRVLVAFTVVKAENHVFKTTKRNNVGVEEDIGAGHLVIAKVLGTRVEEKDGSVLLDTMVDKPIVEAAK